MRLYVAMIVIGTTLILLSVVAGILLTSMPKANDAIPQPIPTPEYSCGVVTD